MRKSSSIISLLLMAVIFLLLTFACDNDCPTCPSCPELDNDYLFYVVGHKSLPVPIKVFSVEQQGFIDSFDVNVSFDKFEVVGDDEQLIIGGLPGYTVIDLKTKQTVYTNDNWWSIRLSPDDKYIAVDDISVGQLQLLTRHNFDVVYFDTMGSLGTFSNDSRHYTYAHQYLYPEVTPVLVTYDIAGDSILDEKSLYYNNAPFFFYDQWPVISKDKIFFIGTPAAGRMLCVTDIGSDEVRILENISTFSIFDMVVSPDDKYLYFTAMPITDVDPPREYIEVFDTETEELVTRIPTSTDTWYHEPDKMALTYDGKYLMAATQAPFWQNIVLVDAKFFTPLFEMKFGDQTTPYLVCTKQ